MAVCQDPHSECGSAGNSSGIGMQDARQKLPCTARRKNHRGRDWGKLVLHRLSSAGFTVHCSPLKISGNFSFPFFEGNLLKQAVTDK